MNMQCSELRSSCYRVLIGEVRASYRGGLTKGNRLTPSPRLKVVVP